jgi:hypothetical protein
MTNRMLMAGLTIVAVLIAATAFVGCHSEATSTGSAVATSSTDSSVVPSQGGSQGDFNGNGTPDVTDAVALLRIIVGLDPANALADCDCDSVTAITDAVLLLRCIVGLSDWPLTCVDVPLGPVRMIQPGDRWEYAVTAAPRCPPHRPTATGSFRPRRLIWGLRLTMQSTR